MLFMIRGCAMKLCIYCVMKDFGGKKIPLKSIDNQKVILIHSNELYAAVSYTKHKKFEDTPGNRKIHEDIIKTVRKQTSVVPFPLNTIVGETIGKGVLFKNYGKLKDELENIGDKEEFVVYVDRDTDNNMKTFLSLLHPDNNRVNSGDKTIKTRYNKSLDIAGHKIAARIHNQFDQLSDVSRYERLKSNNRLMEGYYLVTKKKTDKFRNAITWLKSLYPDLVFITQGPQLPYNFNTRDLTDRNTKLFGRRHSRD